MYTANPTRLDDVLDDVFDTRQIIELIDNLSTTVDDDQALCRYCERPIERENSTWIDPLATGDDEVWRETCDAHDTFVANHEPDDEDERQEARDELARVLPFAEELEACAPDYRYGETVIRDDYFVTYAQELAEDIGAIDRDASWPLSYIDWDAAADALRGDYSAVELDGVTYWTR